MFPVGGIYKPLICTVLIIKMFCELPYDVYLTQSKIFIMNLYLIENDNFIGD